MQTLYRHNLRYSEHGLINYLKIGLVSVVVPILFITGCDFFNEEDNGNGVQFWDALSSYHELGTLSVEQLEEIYPSEFSPVFNHDVTVFRVVYHTETLQGEAVQASGVVLIPSGVDKAPVVSLHRSAVFHEDEAPSNVDLQNPDSGNTFWLNLAPVSASAGMITVMPDLLGWGESRQLFHPFMVPDSDRIAAYDMLVAAEDLLGEEEIERGEDLYLAGYSQGGTTALALLQEIQSDPAQRFAVTKASIGGGAYNLEEVVEAVLEQDEMAFAPFYVYFLKAYRSVYFPNITLSRFFNSPYDQLIVQDELFRGGFTGPEIADRLPATTGELIRPLFRNQYLAGTEIDLRPVLAENDLSDFRVESPLRIYHGEEDQIVPFSEVERAFHRLQNAGSNQVELYTVEEASHFEAAGTYFRETFLWFRFE